MFRYHFLSHFLAELNEVCYASLLNSVHSSKILIKHYESFAPKNLKFMANIFVFFTHQKLLHYFFNETENTCALFFVCIFSMGVQLFTAFELPVSKSCILACAIKSKMAMEMKCGKQIILGVLPREVELVLE